LKSSRNRNCDLRSLLLTSEGADGGILVGLATKRKL
jgi:hypothetical protein